MVSDLSLSLRNAQLPLSSISCLCFFLCFLSFFLMNIQLAASVKVFLLLQICTSLHNGTSNTCMQVSGFCFQQQRSNTKINLLTLALDSWRQCRENFGIIQDGSKWQSAHMRHSMCETDILCESKMWNVSGLMWNRFANWGATKCFYIYIRIYIKPLINRTSWNWISGKLTPLC